jgi:hypothetical protein
VTRPALLLALYLSIATERHLLDEAVRERDTPAVVHHQRVTQWLAFAFIEASHRGFVSSDLQAI